jgi:hypothetical protein
LGVAVSPLNARNPLKSLDSEEGILGNERNFKPQMKGKARDGKRKQAKRNLRYSRDELLIYGPR